MVYIPSIRTPSLDIISVDTLLRVSQDVVCSSNANIFKKFNVSGSCTFGNGGISDTVIFGNNTFLCNGLNFNSTVTTADLSFNSNTLYFDVSTGRVGIGTTVPLADFDVRGSTNFNTTGIVTVNFGALSLYPTLNRIGMNGAQVDTRLNLVGNVWLDTTNNTFYFDSINKRLGIGTSSPSTRLHVVGQPVSANKKIDPNTLILIEDAGRTGIQIGSAQYLAENCAGIVFTAIDVVTSGPQPPRHMSIYGNWGNGTTGPGAGSPLAPSNPTINDLCFSYLSSSNTTTPLYNSTNYTVGYMRDSVAVADIFFTGQHRSLPSENNLEFYIDKIGLIVVSDGIYSKTLDVDDDEETTISINESLPKVKLSQSRNDKRVFGVISDKEDLGDKRYYNKGIFGSVINKREDDHRLIINSVGEGGIWICNINGNLENGEYITSCEIPGYGMKQDSDLLMNYTVAKITCDCDFNLNSTVYKCEEFEFSGSTYRRAFVGCTYHCG
jgi:hypothetical protein